MTLTATELANVIRLADFEPLARAVMDAAAYDYVAGGSWDEITLQANEEAWRRRRLRPRVLLDVSELDTSTTLVGSPASFPLAIAPMAIHGIAQPDGEVATARAAAAAGVPFTLSTMATRSIEDVAAGAPDGTLWFQLYLQRDRGLSRSFVDRAAAAGYRAIVVTVDLPILGYRERDLRSGFELPSLGNFVDAVPAHQITFRNAVNARADGLAPRNMIWDDLAPIRSWSTLPIILKGILTGEDARIAVDHGVDAIVVSNHGGRQLDRVPAAIDVLAEVVDAVGKRVEVWVDGGVQRGLDIAIALALGARGVLLGRPVFWALAAAGQPGVERALAIMREEFELALGLLGASTPSALGPDHVA